MTAPALTSQIPHLADDRLGDYPETPAGTALPAPDSPAHDLARAIQLAWDKRFPAPADTADRGLDYQLAAVAAATVLARVDALGIAPVPPSGEIALADTPAFREAVRSRWVAALAYLPEAKAMGAPEWMLADFPTVAAESKAEAETCGRCAYGRVLIPGRPCACDSVQPDGQHEPFCGMGYCPEGCWDRLHPQPKPKAGAGGHMNRARQRTRAGKPAAKPKAPAGETAGDDADE
jgi:hypothetical protein